MTDMEWLQWVKGITDHKELVRAFLDFHSWGNFRDPYYEDFERVLWERAEELNDDRRDQRKANMASCRR